MNLTELQELRREKWCEKGNPIRTLDDGRAFMESVGFCLMYPMHPPVLAPTFIGAYAGTDVDLPTWQKAFADPRAKDATELMVRLLRDHAAYEANVFGETNFLVSASVFPYFFALVGDRSPRTMPKPGTRSDFSPLARDCFVAINKHGAMSKAQLHDRLGGALTDAALDRALNDLWTRLRITRVDYRPGEGAFWDVLYRWSPDAVKVGVEASFPEALSALVSKYVESMIAVEAGEVEEFFGLMVARSKVKDAINALLAAREFSMVHVGNRAMLQITSHEPVPVPALDRNQPIARRPGGPRPIRRGRRP